MAGASRRVFIIINPNTRIFILPFILLVLVSVPLFFIFSPEMCLSFFLGGLINIIPSFLFGKIFFKNTGARAAKKIVKAFYWGEAVKIFTTVLFFIAVFQWPAVKALPLFLGFILAQLTYWMALLFKVQ